MMIINKNNNETGEETKATTETTTHTKEEEEEEESNNKPHDVVETDTSSNSSSPIKNKNPSSPEKTERLKKKKKKKKKQQHQPRIGYEIKLSSSITTATDTSNEITTTNPMKVSSSAASPSCPSLDDEGSDDSNVKDDDDDDVESKEAIASEPVEGGGGGGEEEHDVDHHHNSNLKDYEELSVVSSSSSSSSASSLFSYWDDKSEESTIASDFHGLSRLQKHFEERDRRLNRMLVGKRRLYEISLIQQEYAVRKFNVESYNNNKKKKKVQNKQQRQTQSQKEEEEEEENATNNNKKNKNNNIIPNELSMKNQLLHNLLFERHHTTRGIMIVAFYCIAHLAFYCVNEMIWLYIYDAYLTNVLWKDVYHTLIFLFATTVMRLTGYLFKWVDKSTYDYVKFEMHNRECLGYMDAQLVRYFRHNTNLLSYFNMITFSMAYWAIIQLYYSVLENIIFPPITTWYLSIEQQLQSTMLDEYNIEWKDAKCEMYLEYNIPPSRTYAMLQYKLCSDGEWTIVQNAYHVVMFLIATGVYEILGLKFVTAYD